MKIQPLNTIRWTPYIVYTSWAYLDIKFTRQGFENACWHREACRAIRHAFSKLSLVSFVSKDANLVFYLSVYPLAIMTLLSILVTIRCHRRRHLKSTTSSWPDKDTCLSGQRATMQLILEVTDKYCIRYIQTVLNLTGLCSCAKMCACQVI